MRQSRTISNHVVDAREGYIRALGSYRGLYTV